MRIGLLGAIAPFQAVLPRLYAFCFEELRVEKLIYLANDDQLERWIEQRAHQLVGEHANEAELWLRSLRCINAPASRIDEFVAAERALQGLKRLRMLPSSEEYGFERLGTHNVILCHDAASLDVDELSGCNVVAFGDSEGPRMFQAEGCHFVCPGSLDAAGLMLLDDDDGMLRLRVYNRFGEQLDERLLSHVEELEPEGQFAL